MALPGFRKRRAGASTSSSGSAKDEALQANANMAKGMTKTRRNFIVMAGCFYFLAFIFLILVEIGNTKGTRVLGDIFFFKLDLADILATSVSTSSSLTLTNSIARTLGLHDFYQVGLWNFCEGYDDEGITSCSVPQNMWWFNPVQILQSELFSGASIALPSEVNTILTVLRIASQVMFGFFLAGLILNFVLMCASPLVIYSRWWSLPFSILSFIAALMVVAAACVATAMALVFQYALTSQVDLNINVSIGKKMFAFMWIAAICTFVAFIFHAGLGCCCTSRRDIRTGRKKGRNLPASAPPEVTEKTKRGYNLPKFSRTKPDTSV